MEINFVSKIDDEDLKDISGGATVDKAGYCNRIFSITLSQDELDKLEDEGYLKEGKLHFNDVQKAVNCLKDNDYKVDYIRQPGGLPGFEVNRVNRDLVNTNPAIKLIIK